MSIRKLMVLFVAGALALTACGKKDDDEDKDTGGGGKQDAAMDVEEPDTMPPDPDTGGMDVEEPDTMPPDPDTGASDAGVDGGADVMPSDTTASDTTPSDTTSTDADGGQPTFDGGADTTPSDTTSTDADGGMVAATSIRTLRGQVSVPVGQTTSKEYAVSNVVVTAIHNKGASWGFFVQDASGNAADSGLYVFTQSANATVPSNIKLGSVLRLQGKVENYKTMGSGGLLELVDMSDIQVMSQGTVPAPVSVNAADVALSGPDSETYESVLIEVSNVTVKTKPGQFNDTELQSGLYIGPDVYDYTMDYNPTVNDTYTKIVGTLNYSYGKTEIMPRSKSDITK
mgnify:CR=1 FL=1